MSEPEESKINQTINKYYFILDHILYINANKFMLDKDVIHTIFKNGSVNLIAFSNTNTSSETTSLSEITVWIIQSTHSMFQK